MITFDYLTLKSFLKENESFFCGARLQKIQQPTRRDFLFTIRGNSTKKLYVNIDPQIYHICFINDESYKKRNITIPKKPPMFCMLLRKYLEGFRIVKVNVPDYERIFEIYFESYNELNEKIQLCLAIELMGKYSNIILYNCSNNIILGCAHNVGSEKSRERELSGTLNYVYPQKQNKADILRYFGKIDYDNLNNDFLGISLSFQKLIKKNRLNLEDIKDLLELKKDILPAIEDDEYCIYSDLLSNPITFPTVNDMIDSYYSNHQEDILIKTLRLRLKNIIYPRYTKQKLLADKLLTQLNKKTNSEKYKKYADLIMSNLYNSDDYKKQITVQDWESGKDIVIHLDNNLSLKENAQKYYKLYSKSKSTIEKLSELYTKSMVELNYYEGMLYSINSSGTLIDLEEIKSECIDIGLIKPDDVNKAQSKEINIETVQIGGYSVYIGKNNKQNDYIISKIASPDDYWFHTKDYPGSHILLKLNKKQEPEESVLYECCKLAKEYSTLSNSTKAGVIYTKRKYIKKPPQANLGYVTYKNEKEVIVN